MKIIDLLGTQYIAAHWLRDLQYIIGLLKEDKDSVKWGKQLQVLRNEGKPYTIDLADAKVCRDVMAYISNFNDLDFHFIDTEDHVRNGMLEENRRRLALDYTTEKLPALKDQEHIPNYITDLKSGIVYSAGDMSSGLLVRLAIIVQAYRPDIMLDLTGQYDAIFLYIANYINIRTYDCDRVCYVIGTTIFTQEREDDGTVHVPGEGDISWDSFVSRYVCIPAEFGTKCLCMDERWRPLVQQCIREIPQFLDKHISITDYFSKE